MRNAPRPPVQPRHAPKLRRAVHLHVIEGLPLADAAEQAGMTLDGMQKAWARPAVRQLAADMQADYIRAIEERMPLLRARAIEAAARLIETGRSDAVRMRAVETVLGGRPVPTPVAPATPAAPDPAWTGGYDYPVRRPAERPEAANG